MNPVERYCRVLGITPDTPAEEMEQRYVSLLQELNGRQQALAGDPEAQDAIEQRVRDLMEAYAYLARYYEDCSAEVKGQNEKPGDVEPKLQDQIIVNGAEPPQVSEPPILVSDRHLQLLFRFAVGLFLCALIAILLSRYGVGREEPEARSVPTAVTSADMAVQAVQVTVSTSGSMIKDEAEKKERKIVSKRSVSRGNVSRAGTFPLRGRVISVVNGGEYSYIHVGLPRGQIWLATPQTSAIHIGDRIESPNGPQILNYHSSILHRTVDRIIFPSAVRVNGRILDK